jgi:hypothetical protein
MYHGRDVDGWVRQLDVSPSTRHWSVEVYVSHDPHQGATVVFGYIEGSFLVSRTGDVRERYESGKCSNLPPFVTPSTAPIFEVYFVYFLFRGTIEPKKFGKSTSKEHTKGNWYKRTSGFLGLNLFFEKKS